MGAPKGNKNALGNNGGKPPVYDSPEKLQISVDLYFDYKEGKKTISGLAYHLGFESRQSFYDYESKVEFAYIIKRARLRIEALYEENLQSNNVAGSIFALKNMGWFDRQEITGKDGEPVITSITTKVIRNEP